MQTGVRTVSQWKEMKATITFNFPFQAPSKQGPFELLEMSLFKAPWMDGILMDQAGEILLLLSIKRGDHGKVSLFINHKVCMPQKWKSADVIERFLQNMVYFIFKFLRWGSFDIKDEVAEWLRRWTANPMCSARVGSNPILVGKFFLPFFQTFMTLIT